MIFPIKGGQDWTPELLDDTYLEIENLWKEKYGISFYTNQIEIISAEQMIDAYAAVGLPILYEHWTYGKEFVTQQELYRRGHMGLAYEIVINSSPCISYCMEENTMLMQTLVMCHAAFGHNSFFKNNYLFKQWTDAEGIIDYLVFAKKYIRDMEEIHGYERVEQILDAAHAIQNYGVDKYRRPPRLSVVEEKEREKDRSRHIQDQLNVLWTTIPTTKDESSDTDDEDVFPKEPQENMLYFLEKNAPKLESWEREILRIVRKVSQYFYPQRQTQLINEGWACTIHYLLIHDLYNRGILDEGAMLEFYQSHTNVVYQPLYDSPSFQGINVYALGFAMFMDIIRISDPASCTSEDRKWFSWAGNGEWLKNIIFAMENFKDESFILQYFSPKVARDFSMFSIHDDHSKSEYEITHISDDRSFRELRERLSDQYNIGYHMPDIQIVKVNRWSDRTMILRHNMVNDRPLAENTAKEVLKHIYLLWGYSVKLESVDASGSVISTYEIV